MVLTDSLGRHNSLSSQYAGFRDFDEPMRVVTPTRSCPADNGASLFTPFGSEEQQGGETTLAENWWPRRGRNMGEGEAAPFRSLSLGSYAWASSTLFEEVDTDLRSENGTQAVLEIDPDTDFMEKVINSSGSMIILQTTYEATLKSLGLIDSEDEDSSMEDTDFLFSRWGFHNGRPSSIPYPEPITLGGNLKGSSKVLSSKPDNKQQGKRWRILSANARKLPSTISGKCQCMPWSWRRIRSWGKRRKDYNRVLGSSDDDEIISISPAQRSYTDGHSVVICNTLSFTDLRQRKRLHRPCFSWGGVENSQPTEDEICLLNNAEHSGGKKAD